MTLVSGELTGALASVQICLRPVAQVDGLEANQVVPDGKVVVPDDPGCFGGLAVEHLHVSIRLAEVVPPQPRGSDHRHVEAAHAVLGRAAVGVDHAVALAAAGAVAGLAATLTAAGAAQRLSAGADVVADGAAEARLEEGVVTHLQRANGAFQASGQRLTRRPPGAPRSPPRSPPRRPPGAPRSPGGGSDYQQVQGAELVPDQTRDPLQRAQPLLETRRPMWVEEDVPHVSVSSQDIGLSVGEGLPEGGPGLQASALGVAELGRGADRHPFDDGLGLHRQTVADGLDGHVTHGGLAGPDGSDGVDPPPQVDPADEVSPVDGHELLEGGVLVAVGGGEVLQGLHELFTQRRPRVDAEAGSTDTD